MSERDPGNSIRWHICDGGHLHVDVLDAEDRPVATFVMDGDDAEHFAIGLIAEIDRWREFAGDTIGTVEGHA